MFNAKAYKQAVEDLQWDSLTVAGLVASLLPRTARPGSKIARGSGSHWNNHDLMTIAKKIEDLTYRFDQVQHALGLWEHDARFGHGPAGSTNALTEESLTPTTTKKRTAKSKTKVT